MNQMARFVFWRFATGAGSPVVAVQCNVVPGLVAEYWHFQRVRSDKDLCRRLFAQIHNSNGNHQSLLIRGVIANLAIDIHDNKSRVEGPCDEKSIKKRPLNKTK